MTHKNLIAWILCAYAVGVTPDAFAAAAAKTQSVIQRGTTVRTKANATGLYSQECYDAYYGCMDQFCITENSNGGSCACSDDNAKYEKQFAQIQDKLNEAERVATIEVEKVKAGANADIIFTGTREYDENGNLKSVDALTKSNSAAATKEKKRADLMAMWNTTNYGDDDDDDGLVDNAMTAIGSKTGTALYRAAEEICMEIVPDSCAKDMTFLRQLYSRQITSDCKAFENVVKSKQAEADIALAQANADVRTALKESFDAANKYDLGQCMVEFKKCMVTDDACGADWINCVSVVAAENAQVETTSTAHTPVAKTTNVYDITQATMDILNSKRTICEHVLSQCVVVRDQVWPAFLREAAPTIRVAESSAESKFRQSCLTNISNCITTACRDDIVGKGTATMDACLSRPDMARSFCKVEIDPCERMEPLIWGYVVDKLAAMRVDACTQEVKDCFTDNTRCGPNFENCIGMDYNYIHEMCPVDKLVVCKASNPNFSMADLDSMLMGLYLNIDNSALTQCQELVDRKMAEICGSTTDCNKFAADDTIGTGSLRSQKDGTIYRVTGMISFGSIKMGDMSGEITDNGAKLGPGEIGVADYLAQVRQRNASVKNANAIISSIESELNNIAGTINRTIAMIESDPQIQFCVTGRNLSQINGKDESTTGRFPNLLTQVKMQIATAALKQAQVNYNAKLNAEIAKATHDASADVAQYLCQMMPVSGGGVTLDGVNVDTPLAAPYAISYDVGAGLENSMLVRGGRGSGTTGGVATMDNDANAGRNKVSDVAATVLTLGANQLLGANNRTKTEIPGGTREMWSIFNRENRVCHYCTSTVTKSCTSTHKKGFLGIGASDDMTCTESDPVETCEDIQM